MQGVGGAAPPPLAPPPTVPTVPTTAPTTAAAAPPGGVVVAAAAAQAPPVAPPVAPANQDIADATRWIDTNLGEGSHQDFLFKIARGGKKVKTTLLGPIIRALIKGGADVEAKVWYGYTLLMFAAENGREEIVKVLLAAGADVNAIDEDENTALMWAALHGNTECLKLLLEAGADVNARDKYRWTALMLAAQNGHTEIVKLLLDRGAEVEAKNEDGMTVLMLAAFYEHTEIVKVLCEAGADLNAGDCHGNTVLMGAVRKRDKETVEALLAHGADLNARNECKKTALMLANFMALESFHQNRQEVFIRNLLQAVQANEMKPLSKISEHFKGRMERRRNTTSWIEQAIHNGQTLDSLQKLQPGLEEKLNDPNYKKNLARRVLERMPKDEKDRLPINRVPELATVYHHVVHLGLLTREECSIFRVTHPKTGIPNQNLTLNELARIIRERLLSATKI